MSKRLIALLLMVVMALMIVPTASAQNACYNLDAADCEMINAASAKSRTMTSFTQTFTLDLSITGLEFIAAFAPDAGLPGDIVLTITGSGPVAFTPDSADALIFSADMTVEGTIGPDPVSGPVSAVLVDEVLYLTFDGQTIGIPAGADMAGDAVGGLGDAVGGLGGLDLSEAVDTQANPANLGELLGIDEAEVGTELGDMVNMLGFGDFIDYVRLADADVMGASAAPFRFTVDLNGLINSDQLAGLLALGAGTDGGAEMDENLQLIRDALLADLSITQYVGSSNGYIRQVDFDTNIELDLGAAAGSPGLLPPIVVAVDFSVMISDIDAPVSISAPEGAEMIDPDSFDLGGILGGGM